MRPSPLPPARAGSGCTSRSAGDAQVRGRRDLGRWEGLEEGAERRGSTPWLHPVAPRRLVTETAKPLRRPPPAGPTDLRDPAEGQKPKCEEENQTSWPQVVRTSMLKEDTGLGCSFESFPLLNIDPETKNKQRSSLKQTFGCLCVPGTVCF